MKIVTDTGMDLYMPLEWMPDIEINVIPHIISLDGKIYRSGVDIQPTELYQLMMQTSSFPNTSLPPIGEFVDLYRRLAKDDPEILSLHLSGTVSGTYNTAKAAAGLVPEANITVIDTRLFSAVLGWQVAAAARAIKAGWPVQQILEFIGRIRAASESIFTLDDLKYAIHGGRVGHLKGLIATLVGIKPLLRIDKVKGDLVQLGQTRTMRHAVSSLANMVSRYHNQGAELVVQVLHANNAKSALELQDQVDRSYQCRWLPIGNIAPVMGAHSGPGMVGIAFAPAAIFSQMP